MSFPKNHSCDVASLYKKGSADIVDKLAQVALGLSSGIYDTHELHVSGSATYTTVAANINSNEIHNCFGAEIHKNPTLASSRYKLSNLTQPTSQPISLTQHNAIPYISPNFMRFPDATLTSEPCKQKLNSRQATWYLRMSEFNYQIYY